MAAVRKELNTCSWCGVKGDKLDEHDVRDDVPSSDLLLYDGYPHAFCVRCATLSHGGDTGSNQEREEEEEQEWRCCKCVPTEFLGRLRLRSAYDRMTRRDPEVINVDTEDVDKGDKNEVEDDKDGDDEIQALIDCATSSKSTWNRSVMPWVRGGPCI